MQLDTGKSKGLVGTFSSIVKEEGYVFSVGSPGIISTKFSSTVVSVGFIGVNYNSS
jgi:hypothetical protein